MNNKTFYYARVSSQSQHLDRQIEAFKKLGADEREIICDKESGKDLDRVGYQALKNNMLRSGDTLYIQSLDRLSRTKSHIHQELQWFKEHKIRLKILDLPTTLVDFDGQEWILEMVNNILIEVISSVAQQERESIRSRQASGILAAKKQGKHLGRPKLQKPENWDIVIADYQDKTISVKSAMELLGLKQTSFYRLLNKEKERNQTPQST